MYFKVGALKNFVNFTRKRLCWGLFLIKFRMSWNFIKNRLQHRCFPVKFEKFLKTSFFYKTPPVDVSETPFFGGEKICRRLFRSSSDKSIRNRYSESFQNVSASL